eukprot:Skav213998  [mRNA]  locus=scaffold941:61501:68903:+ [translate_table: standard]
MSVQDLVTEVEVALVEGERLDEDQGSWGLLMGAPWLHRGSTVAPPWLHRGSDKDINDSSGSPTATWHAHGVSGLTEKLKEDGAFFAHEKDIMEMTGKIQEVDYKIAGLRHKHHHNIKDVGSLKRTMSLIEKRGKEPKDTDGVEKPQRSPAPKRPAVARSAPRRLNGKPTHPTLPGNPQVEARGPPLRLKVDSRDRKRKVPEPPSNPPEVWERVIDASRNAPYYWEHRTRRSSWEVPPEMFGWWERLRTDTNLEFFWNSATQLGRFLSLMFLNFTFTDCQLLINSGRHQVLWNLPLASTQSASVSLSLNDEPSVCRSVTTLIDKTEEALDKGEVSQAVQLEADLTQVVERLRKESAKIWPKISSYEENIAELSTKMCLE